MRKLLLITAAVLAILAVTRLENAATTSAFAPGHAGNRTLPQPQMPARVESWFDDVMYPVSEDAKGSRLVSPVGDAARELNPGHAGITPGE